ncbi:hypothetical protein LT85_p017 (plasmid) [Collimonas arenae]|uniref:Uncharacterized protein n=1 Tax=Collimonas arenae TaxID=279058 RepID=A0A0A1FHZ5_9BURK|nr:hypothetical protein [Collimonas arenae]AIY44196.1 hypothetical protein LT85_p017 [Collimonas arenae]
MKLFFLLLKIVFAPAWIPFWIIKKSWRFFAILFLGAIIAGCASNSAKLDTSPCAGCDFRPIDNTPYIEVTNA